MEEKRDDLVNYVLEFARVSGLDDGGSAGSKI